MVRGLLVPTVALVWGLCGVASAQFALHDGDRVVAYGDSITDNSAYETYLETFVVTRFPKMNVRFFNAGVGGDKVTGGRLGPVDKRLDRDLFSRKPTVVTVMLGMNDGGYQAFNSGLFDAYRKGYEHIVDRIKQEAPQARLWLFQPTPYDEISRAPEIADGGYNAVLLKYGAFVNELATQRKLGVIDLNAPFTEALTKAASLEPANAAKILPDRIHPRGAGHLLMAAAILKGWGAPSLVSRTEIDAETAKSDASGAVISSVSNQDGLRWVSLEDSLPFPIDGKEPLTNLMLRSAPIQEWFGKELVIVHHLAPGNYKLLVDGQEVGQFSAATFDSGVDLSWLPTPMLRQAERVHDWTTKRAALRYGQWRNVEVGLEEITGRPATDAAHAIDQLEEEVIRRQHAAAIPVAHRFAVTRA